jgi:hypothetical protein
VVELGEDHRAHAIGVLLAGKDDKERIKIEGVRWGLDRVEEERPDGLGWAGSGHQEERKEERWPR